jgi:hypothetical protein
LFCIALALTRCPCPLGKPCGSKVRRSPPPPPPRPLLICCLPVAIASCFARLTEATNSALLLRRCFTVCVLRTSARQFIRTSFLDALVAICGALGIALALRKKPASNHAHNKPTTLPTEETTPCTAIRRELRFLRGSRVTAPCTFHCIVASGSGARQGGRNRGAEVRRGEPEQEGYKRIRKEGGKEMMMVVSATHEHHVGGAGRCRSLSLHVAACPPMYVDVFTCL